MTEEDDGAPPQWTSPPAPKMVEMECEEEPKELLKDDRHSEDESKQIEDEDEQSTPSAPPLLDFPPVSTLPPTPPLPSSPTVIEEQDSEDDGPPPGWDNNYQLKEQAEQLATPATVSEISSATSETLLSDVHQVVEDDWTTVLPRRNNQKRKFPKLKSAKQQQEETRWTPTDLETTPERELKLLQKMKISIEKLGKSRFFNVFLDQIHTSEATDHFRNLTGSKQKLKMVIYGIGSIESFESPRLQLSLAILMKRKLDWIGEMEVFDPVISLTESKVLEELGCCVLSVNEQGKRQVFDPTLFFMPHCEVELYDNLLKTNWRYGNLNKIILFGNSFEKYEQHRLVFKNSASDDSRKHLLAVRPFTKEFEIFTVSDDYFRAFHGSSWHFFSVDPDTNLQVKTISLKKKQGLVQHHWEVKTSYLLC